MNYSRTNFDEMFEDLVEEIINDYNEDMDKLNQLILKEDLKRLEAAPATHNCICPKEFFKLDGCGCQCKGS